MLLSTSHNFLFIAVPKTASSSVELALQGYHNASRAEPLGKHALAMEVTDHLAPSELAALFKFGFVRNPYSWMWSWYRFRQRPELSNPAHRHHDRYAGDMDFDEFMKVFNRGQVFLKQSDFLFSHQDEQLVDFVGRFETLEQDLEAVCERLQVPAPALERVNSSGGAAFDPSAIGSDARNLINQHFHRDFELFGYEMLE